MFFLKMVTLMMAGFLTLLALKLVTAGVKGAALRSNARQRPKSKTVIRLTQDPQTGIYYPEE